MDYLLPAYLSINSDSIDEQNYVNGLIEQFGKSIEIKSYHLGLFAYHLIFICFFYQTLHRLKLWMPEKHHIAMVSFGKERRRKFREAVNATDYAHSENSEAGLFEFLNVFCDCEDLVARCKSLVSYRNTRLGHVNYLLVSEESFYEKLKEYDACANGILAIYMSVLDEQVEKFINSLSKEEINLITRDDIDLGLVAPNRLSRMDLMTIKNYLEEKKDKNLKNITNILQNDFIFN